MSLKCEYNKFSLTLCAIVSATSGPSIPGIVPTELVIPINTPAYWGAMSMWLMLKPAAIKPPKLDMSVNNETQIAFSEPK